ncbi:MAG TPA: hypothetical protein VMU84_17820 [Thermoanaerobaculia bacterium]|nr:hypothetical protein [Thermoanaerobaculia bacterium]
MNLDPHVLLVTVAAQPSRAAMLLTQGGYLVTKTTAEHASDATSACVPEAVVVDLPAFDEVNVMRVLDHMKPRPPVLVLTNLPRLYPKKRGDRYALCRAEVESDLICAVDRMLADAA